MLKASPPTLEELEFCHKVNKQLTEGRVSAYSRIDTETGARTYGLIFALGPKRKTIESDQPFYYDPPEDVIKRVRDWMTEVAQARRWQPATAEDFE